MTTLNHDGFTTVLVQQINDGIAAIDSANETLLAEETGTPVREIDKVLKAEDAELPKNIKKLASDAEAAYKVYRENLEAARNAYRTEVLGEEAKSAPTADEAELKEKNKEVRKLVMQSLEFLKTYATSNGKPEFVEWANGISVPQVGRQGSSTVGAKKPRVFVKVDDVVYDSFSLAAVALSTKENKVTAGEMAEAWNSAGGAEGEFTFGDHTVGVTYKPKKSDSK